MIDLVLVLAAFGMAVVYAAVLNGWREVVARELAGNDPAPHSPSATTITMVVPARNAAETITALLQDLYAQEYDKRSVSVIVVDDASEDATAEKVRSLMARWPQLRMLANDGVGKKAAITTAVFATDAEWILLTDADARCGPGRLPALMEHVRRVPGDMVLMPVATDGEGPLGAMQGNEQAALMMCAAATALQGRPMLANGANMAFRRAAFMELRGFDGDRYASGDDVFLVQRMRAAGKRVSYLLGRSAIVRVEAERGQRGFFQQRLRWSGKMRGVPWRSKWMPALALLFPWLLLFITVKLDWPGMVGKRFFMGASLMAGAWAIWLTAVPPLVRDGKHFLAQRYSFTGALLSFWAFTVYAPVIAALGLFVKPEWKGRRLR